MPHIQTDQGNTNYTDTITPQFVDWLLYDLYYLRQCCEEIMPRTSTSIVMFHPRVKTMVRSKIEAVACRRATLTSVLDAVERAIRRQDQEHKKIYNMKYRAGMSIRNIAKKMFFAKNTVQSKVDEVRNDVCLALQDVPASHLREFVIVNSQDRG